MYKMYFPFFGKMQAKDISNKSGTHLKDVSFALILYKNF